VVERWEDLKARETGSKGEQRTALGGVPKALPALLRTHEIGIRASAVGFDWERPADVVAKIEEEVEELRELVDNGASGADGRAEEEMGDLLFAIANLSRKLGIEPESALRKANDKFSRRFSAMESRLRAAGRSLSECALQEMEDEWGRVKQAERSASADPAAGSASAR
jgi:MazG family protein